MPDNALSVTLDGSPDLPSAVLQALYRITGRSTVELRRSIRAGDPFYSAALFGDDHLETVPRLEKTITHLTATGLPFSLHARIDGEREEISMDAMRSILEGSDGTLA